MEKLILILVICTFWNVLILLWKVSNKNIKKEFTNGYDLGYRSGQRDAMKEFKIINDRIREKELVRFKRISEGILNDLEGFNKNIMKINSKGYIEPEIGEIIEILGGIKVKVVRGYNCRKCHFENILCSHIPCGSETRDDGLDIKYKEIKDE